MILDLETGPGLVWDFDLEWEPSRRDWDLDLDLDLDSGLDLDRDLIRNRGNI
jgi:hypothetical protein